MTMVVMIVMGTTTIAATAAVLSLKLQAHHDSTVRIPTAASQQELPSFLDVSMNRFLFLFSPQINFSRVELQRRRAR
jgi:precorrin-2 methylase